MPPLSRRSLLRASMILADSSASLNSAQPKVRIEDVVEDVPLIHLKIVSRHLLACAVPLFATNEKRSHRIVDGDLVRSYSEGARLNFAFHFELESDPRPPFFRTAAYAAFS